jgi:DNA polymerase-3 subunit epsilon
MSQLAFEFEPSPERKAAPAVAAHAQPLTPEGMAKLLAQHPDYRVLRRLVPVLDHGPSPASRPAGVQRVLVLDTETTGLSHASDKIIELAMLLVQVDAATGQPFGAVETFEGCEDPGMPIPEVAQQVTGLSDDMVRGQRLADARVQALIDQAALVVAHNAGIDRPFVEARFPGFALKPWACSFADIDWKALGAESAKLSALAQNQGWFYDAHRALVDCHALLQVLGQRVGDDGLNVLISAQS